MTTLNKILCVVMLSQLLLAISCSDKRINDSPNVLLIVADDIGFSDLGCYGGEILTPNLDQLAKTGVINTSLCTAPTCSPTRAMLLSGVDSHLNGYGTMEGDWADNQVGLKGYEGYLNFDVVAFPRLLQDAGYHTSISGKWHQAYPASRSDLWPDQRGFTRSYCLIHGGASHFADKIPILEQMGRALYVKDGIEIEDLPDNFYSSKNYVDQSIAHIQESLQQNKPFFSFLAFTAPHWPLQVPDEYIDQYKGKYDEGYENLGQSRLNGLIENGIISDGTEASVLSPNVIPWNDLSISGRQKSIKGMEIYAAMIERLDYHIGRLIAFLKESGEYGNTLIIFMGDNGAEGNTIMGVGNTRQWVEENFDNSLDNMGRKNSYVEIGAGWAQASSLPFKWYKGFSTEGGVRVPAIFSYPKWSIDQTIINSQFISVLDLAPTILDYAGVTHPGTKYQNRKIFPLDGKSLEPWLEGQTSTIRDQDEIICAELYGRRSVRMGPWKAEWMEKPYGTESWQLYDLSSDIAQRLDLADENPDILNSLIAAWEGYINEKKVTLPDEPTAYGELSLWDEKVIY